MDDSSFDGKLADSELIETKVGSLEDDEEVLVWVT